jgi:hypothetical protein
MDQLHCPERLSDILNDGTDGAHLFKKVRFLNPQTPTQVLRQLLGGLAMEADIQLSLFLRKVMHP